MERHGIVVQPIANLAATFNPGAVKTADGRYVLLVRSVPEGYTKNAATNQFNDDNYTSQLSLWEGSSPDHFGLVNAAAIKPDTPYDRFGVEDPRITKIGDTWYICYTALAKGLGQPDVEKGIRIALASTKDFRTFTKHGVIGPDSRSKAGTLFESGGKVHFLWKDENGTERTMLSPAPADFENPEAWKKLWADKTVEHHELLGARNNGYESRGAEPGAPPIEIDEGLLLVYSSISNAPEWTISLLLLDKNDPSRIIARTEAPVLVPERAYEREGDANNAIFPCGALIDKGSLYIYYGAGDKVCAVARESMDAVRKMLKPAQAPTPGFNPA